MDSRVAVDRVLVPVDGTDASLNAVEYAVAIAEQYDAKLSVVYVFDEETRQAIRAENRDADAIADDSHAFLQRVFDRTERHEVPVSTMTVFGFSTRRKTHHPGSIILDGADQVDSDFLVIPREDHDYGVLSKAASYVLSYASQPVLSV